jgi:hypothetical protein
MLETVLAYGIKQPNPETAWCFPVEFSQALL